MIGLLRQFAFYLQRNGHDAYVFPTELFPKEKHLYTPYIFTRNEIASLLKATEKISPNREFLTRHMVLPLLFRTLYCCGLRISEALDLTIGDIDFKNGILVLKNMKDYRDRLIPLSSDLHRGIWFIANGCIQGTQAIRISSSPTTERSTVEWPWRQTSGTCSGNAAFPMEVGKRGRISMTYAILFRSTVSSRQWQGDRI